MHRIGWMIIPCLLAIAVTHSVAQDGTNVWKTLAKITFKKEYDDLLGFKVDRPVFSEDIQKLSGKEVTVTGYIIPVEGYKSHTEFIFSAYPYNMCFFCGGAGPESVMEVISKEPIKYSAEGCTQHWTKRKRDGIDEHQMQKQQSADCD